MRKKMIFPLLKSIFERSFVVSIHVHHDKVIGGPLIIIHDFEEKGNDTTKEEERRVTDKVFRFLFMKGRWCDKLSPH